MKGWKTKTKNKRDEEEQKKNKRGKKKTEEKKEKEETCASTQKGKNSSNHHFSPHRHLEPLSFCHHHHQRHRQVSLPSPPPPFSSSPSVALRYSSEQWRVFSIVFCTTQTKMVGLGPTQSHKKKICWAIVDPTLFWANIGPTPVSGRPHPNFFWADLGPAGVGLAGPS